MSDSLVKRYAVFGEPIAHSFSPQIYSQLFENNNITATYNRIVARKASEIMHFIDEFDLVGANITAPAKSGVLPLCSHITPDAQSIGAVNTIIRNKSQQLFGFNTDWEGVLTALNNHLALNPQLKLDINKSKILIVGAGQAATAVVFGLTKFYRNADITITNRTLKNAQKLALKFKLKCLDVAIVDNKILQKYDIVFFTTTEYISIDAREISFTSLTTETISTLLFFANYTNYPLFEKLRTYNFNFISGTNWLKYQAISAFEYFYSNDDFCSKFKLDDDIVSSELSAFNQRNIYFVGFSGAGKSYIGKKIAKKNCKKKIIDVDSEIEKITNKSITELLNEGNEKEFRRLELAIIKEHSQLKNFIISLGAGAICNPEMQQLIKQTNGFVVYLYADLQTSLSRFDIATRPLLANKTSTEIENFFNERKCIYFDNSDLIVTSNTKTIETLHDNLLI